MHVYMAKNLQDGAQEGMSFHHIMSPLLDVISYESLERRKKIPSPNSKKF